MNKPGHVALKRIALAAFFSAKGFRSAWHNEAAFRQEIVLSLVLGPFGVWLGQNAVEHILLLGSLLIVLCVELLNTAVEAAIDRVGFEQHELSGRAKDLGSAAVFVSLVLVGLTYGTIAWQRFA